MPTIGEALFAEAQEQLRRSINDRAKPEGWGLIWTFSENGFSVRPRWVDADRWRNDQYAVLYNSLWELSQLRPGGIEAEAVAWLKQNSPDAYRRVRAGLPDSVLLDPP